MRFVFIQSHARIFHITVMCEVLGVSRAGYYAWRARPLSKRVQADAVLAAQIRGLHHEVRERYGSPRLTRELAARGTPCGRHRVARLMRQQGLHAKRAPASPRTTQSAHRAPIAPNGLARQFALAHHAEPNRAWVADITYVPTRGLALPGRRARPGLAPRRGLEHE